MTFRPSQMRDKFRNLVVTLDPPHSPAHVSITRYACSVTGYGRGQQERQQYKDRLFRATRQDRLHLTAQEFVDVFTGKGTADSIAKCLRLAARHRIYFHDGPAAGPGAGLDVLTGIRRVADEYIGLDCNGFVGNWARTAGVPGASPQRAPLDWLSHAQIRQQLADITANDVVIWHSGTHIAAIESCDAPIPGSNRRNAQVAESSTGGVQLHPYVIRTISTPATVARNGRNYNTPFVADSSIHGQGVRVFIAHLNGLP